MKQRGDLKFLLMQIREDDVTRQEEFFEFVEYGEIQPSQLEPLDCFKTPDFGPEIMAGYDALIVGGSSDATVLKPNVYPFISSCKRLLEHCYEHNVPVFASCFGFQVVIEALGGEIIQDKANMEMGIYPIYLTDAAKDDILLHDLPSPFLAISGHQERAVSLPDNVTLLGYSDLCPYHLIRFDGKPFYAFQFHPEISSKDLIARITRYQTRYLDHPDQLQAIIDNATAETPHANSLVKKFIDRIILPLVAADQK